MEDQQYATLKCSSCDHEPAVVLPPLHEPLPNCPLCAGATKLYRLLAIVAILVVLLAVACATCRTADKRLAISPRAQVRHKEHAADHKREGEMWAH